MDIAKLLKIWRKLLDKSWAAMAAVKLPAPTEAQESRVLMQYMSLRGLMFTHVKNETGRPIPGQKIRNWKAVWDYQDGVRPGFPDFVVILPGQVIAIELKRVKGGKLSQYQIEWIDALNGANLPTFICNGAEQAISIIEKYLTSQVSVKQSSQVF